MNLGKTTGAALMRQSTPWGITRVGGPLDGTGKKAWVLDTGIDLDNPDLNVDVNNSVSYVGGESADDLNGHGTHVAGTIAAKDNSTDVVGVAAGATVVSVKVLDQNGFGNTQDVVDGINYVAGKASSNHIINMSLSGPSSSAIDNAVILAANSGIRFSIAAGNQSIHANNRSPARVENTNVWTVSAYDDNDNFVTAFSCNQNYGSNYGNPPIEYGGPGDNVSSLKPGGGTDIKCGTSMAAPHIAGLLLTVPNNITVDGYVSNDPDNTPDAIAAYTPVQVSVSGPTVRQSGEQGTWTANATDGTGSYSYQWYYRNTPTDPWTSSGSNSSTFNHTFYNTSGSLQSSGVKVEVTSGGEMAEDDIVIGVQSDGCAPGEIFC